jgi:hypothetical protein
MAGKVRHLTVRSGAVSSGGWHLVIFGGETRGVDGWNRQVGCVHWGLFRFGGYRLRGLSGTAPSGRSGKVVFGNVRMERLGSAGQVWSERVARSRRAGIARPIVARSDRQRNEWCRSVRRVRFGTGGLDTKVWCRMAGYVRLGDDDAVASVEVRQRRVGCRGHRMAGSG